MHSPTTGPSVNSILTTSNRVFIALGFVLSLTACKSKSDGPESNADNPPDPPEAAAAAAEPAPCDFVRATRSLVSINVETADGRCLLVLPQSVQTGTLEVGVSVAGREGIASVEIASEEGRYYTNQGTVTITNMTGEGISGSFVVSDTNPPNVGGPWTADFDVRF